MLMVQWCPPTAAWLESSRLVQRPLFLLHPCFHLFWHYLSLSLSLKLFGHMSTLLHPCFQLYGLSLYLSFSPFWAYHYSTPPSLPPFFGHISPSQPFFWIYFTLASNFLALSLLYSTRSSTFFGPISLSLSTFLALSEAISSLPHHCFHLLLAIIFYPIPLSTSFHH